MWIDGKEYVLTSTHRAYEKTAWDKTNADWDNSLNKALKSGKVYYYGRPIREQEFKALLEHGRIRSIRRSSTATGDADGVCEFIATERRPSELDDDYQNIRSTIMNKDA